MWVKGSTEKLEDAEDTELGDLCRSGHSDEQDIEFASAFWLRGIDTLMALFLRLALEFGAESFFFGLELGGEVFAEVGGFVEGADFDGGFGGHRVGAAFDPFHGFF